MKTVILLRRDPQTVSATDLGKLKRRFGEDVQLVRTDPADHRQHLADCERLKAAAVLLPQERPIPSSAMEAGFLHITFMEDGRMGQLTPLIPHFMPLS